MSANVEVSQLRAMKDYLISCKWLNLENLVLKLRSVQGVEQNAHSTSNRWNGIIKPGIEPGLQHIVMVKRYQEKAT